jgi:hypothetical protein
MSGRFEFDRCLFEVNLFAHWMFSNNMQNVPQFPLILILF